MSFGTRKKFKIISKFVFNNRFCFYVIKSKQPRSRDNYPKLYFNILKQWKNKLIYVLEKKANKNIFLVKNKSPKWITIDLP